MTRLPEVLQKHEPEILSEWMKEQLSSGWRQELMKESELHQQSTSVLKELAESTLNGGVSVDSEPFTALRNLLGEISASRARQGFSPSETATFIFSLRQPLMNVMRKSVGKDADALFEETKNISQMVDQLGLLTTEAFIKTREELISHQQQEMLELSTPVIKLWEGVLALPLIGTLDSMRTQVVMESLLGAIVANGTKFAIIDITGVPTVDTLVAQHLFKTVTAARLMGAECIISGIRPQIAQTVVHLGIDMTGISTKATLADALALALKKSNMKVVKTDGRDSKDETRILNGKAESRMDDGN